MKVKSVTHRLFKSDTYRHGITTEVFLKRIDVKPIVSFRGAGNMICMPYEWLPKKMMTSWVPYKRANGCPEHTYMVVVFTKH